MGASLIAALVWAIALGLLETSYFTRKNFLFPLTSGHLWLFLAFLIEYLLLALIPILAFRWISRREDSRAKDTLVWALPAWWLLLILGVSWYRTTLNPAPRTVEGTLWTLAIVAAMIAFLWVLVRLSERFPRLIRGLSVLGALAVSVVGLAGLFNLPKSSQAAGPDTSAAGQLPLFATCSECPRVLLIGLDGGDWKVLDPMIERGELPTFERLLYSGVSARLKTVVPTSSPLIWTSIASGKSVAKHGVRDHTRTQMPLGLPNAPMQAKWFQTLTKPTKLALRYFQGIHPFRPLGLVSSQVEAMRIWEILDLFDLKSIVLDWYVSYPVTLQNGIQVSHRFHTEKGSISRTKGLVQPEEIAKTLEPEIVTPKELEDDLLWGLLDVADLSDEEREALEHDRREWFKAIRWEMARDLTTRSIVERVFPLVPDWKFAGVYYRAMDISHHLAWKYIGLKRPEGSTEDSDWRFRDFVHRYYRYSDALLEATLAHADGNTVVMVLSDHGWEDTLHGHDFAPDGFLIMAGPGIERSSERLDIHVYDIAPTILALLGLPVAEDMDGQVATRFVEEEFWERHPVRWIPSYEPEARPRALGEDGEVVLDEETQEHLRALGYLQ